MIISYSDCVCVTEDDDDNDEESSDTVDTVVSLCVESSRIFGFLASAEDGRVMIPLRGKLYFDVF